MRVTAGTARPRARPAPAYRAAACAALVWAAGCAGERRAGSAATPEVHDAWARPAAAGTDGALYFTLANPGRDTLLVVGARSGVAASTSLHESMRTGEGAGAMVHMTPLDRIAVAPGDSVVFAPLGRHAMLDGLRRPIGVGDSVPFALAIARGGRPGARRGVKPPDTIRATAVVRAF